MKDWDARRAEMWAQSLSSVAVPMFNPHDALCPKGVHSLMLDGLEGSFVLSTASPKDLIGSAEPVRWAWSANVRWSVAVDPTGRHASVRCWDAPNDAKEWPVSHEREAHSLFKSFERSGHPTRGRSVIDRGLKTFRAIRVAIEKQGGSALDVILTFNTVLAWVAQRSDTDEEVEIEFADAIRATQGSRRGGFTLRQISPQLLQYPLGDLARLLRQGDSSTLPYLLEANLLIRHASGPLYQEAHKQLLVPAQRESQGELFPKEMLLVGRERPHTAAPSFVHHTPPSLARALIEVALHFLEVDADNKPLDILDPACGSGVFLIEAVRETGIRQSTPQPIYFRGFDESELAVAMADFCLRNANADNGNHSVTIQRQNSLAIDDWGAPQIIAMNPPFMAWEALDHDNRDLVKRALGPLHRGRPDLAFAFIVRALKSLKPGGVMATLVPPSFLDGQSSAAIRAYVLRSDEFQVRLIGHFHDFNYFDATVEPSFIVVSRSGRETPIQIVTAKSGFVDKAIRALRGGKSISRAGYELYSIASDELPKDRWTPQLKHNLRFIEALTVNTSHTVGDFFVPRLGIRTGNKSVFIVAESDLDRVCPTKRERRFFRPIADRIEAGRIQPSGYVFYPYDTDGTLLLHREPDLRDRVPRFYDERLRTAKKALKDRSRYRKWWEPTRPLTTWLAARTPRIVSQAFGRAGNFAFDSEGKYAVVQGVGWCWKQGDPNEDIMLAYLGLLNSAVFDELLSSFCPRVRGGQYNLTRQFVERIPLPQLGDDGMRDSLSQIGRAMADGYPYDADEQKKFVLRAYGLSPEGEPLDRVEHRQQRIGQEIGPTPIDARIREIGRLREGWFGSDSPRLDPSGLDSFRILMNQLLAHGGIPAPYIYPTPDGGAQAEWSFPSWEVSATASFRSGLVHLQATHLESDASRDAETTLGSTDAVDTLLEFLSEFTREPQAPE